MTRREGHVARAAMVNRCGAPAKGESPVQAASVGTRAAERGEGNIENDNEEEGDEEAVKAMADAGHNVLIVTAPDPSFYAQCSQEKSNWVEKHLGALALVFAYSNPYRRLALRSCELEVRARGNKRVDVVPILREVLAQRVQN